MEKITLSNALALCNATKLTGDKRQEMIAKGKVLVLEQVGRARNEALRKAESSMAESMSKITGGISMPGLF